MHQTHFSHVRPEWHWRYSRMTNTYIWQTQGINLITMTYVVKYCEVYGWRLMSHIYRHTSIRIRYTQILVLCLSPICRRNTISPFKYSVSCVNLKWTWKKTKHSRRRKKWVKGGNEFICAILYNSVICDHFKQHGTSDAWSSGHNRQRQETVRTKAAWEMCRSIPSSA